MFCTVLGTWMANAYGMAMKYYPWRMKKELNIQSFVRQVIIEGLFQQQTQSSALMIPTTTSKTSVSGRSVASSVSSIHSPCLTTSVVTTLPTQTQQQSNITTPHNIEQLQFAVGGKEQSTACTAPRQLIDSQAIDPYVHTMQRHADTLAGGNRQQRCVMCYEEGRNTRTSYYCSLCTLTASKDTDRKPSKHSYCINQQCNCFARHTAKCY